MRPVDAVGQNAARDAFWATGPGYALFPVSSKVVLNRISRGKWPKRSIDVGFDGYAGGRSGPWAGAEAMFRPV